MSSISAGSPPLLARTSTTATRSQIVACAQSYLNSPYQHQGRLKGVAIDCIGLVICVCTELHLITGDYRAYSRDPDGTLQTIVERYCTPVSQYQSGDLLILRNLNGPARHCGIAAERNSCPTLIHAWDSIGKVVEHRLDSDWWGKRIIAAYKLPGVIDVSP